jgi:hypothetical protein
VLFSGGPLRPVPHGSHRSIFHPALNPPKGPLRFFPRMSSATLSNTPLFVFTNVFTVKGKDATTNPYIDAFCIWSQFLRRFGELNPVKDEIHVSIDEPSLAHLQNVTKGTDMLAPFKFHTFPQPATLREGMAQRYRAAARLQWAWPGHSFLYLDVDELVCRPLRGLVSDFAIGRLWYTTEEKIGDYAGGLLTPNYLAGRIVLTPREYGHLQDIPGISSGLFGWNHRDASYGEQFLRLADTLCADTTNAYYTVDQPYFNELVARKLLNKPEELFHIDSNKIGINEPLSPTSPCIVMNYSGDPGNGEDHLLKLEIAFMTVFNG